MVVYRCTEVTKSDYVEFSNFNIKLTDRQMGRICGSTLGRSKRTMESDGNFFRVTFKANGIYDAHGFEANYQFLKKDEGNDDVSIAVWSSHAMRRPAPTDYQSAVGDIADCRLEIGISRQVCAIANLNLNRQSAQSALIGRCTLKRRLDAIQNLQVCANFPTRLDCRL